jgi:hypothetical protein
MIIPFFCLSPEYQGRIVYLIELSLGVKGIENEKPPKGYNDPFGGFPSASSRDRLS